MAAAIPAHATRAAFRPSFFLYMTLVMTLFIFSGFGLTYWIPMASGSLAPLPPVVHLHGAFFFSWMTLLVVQSMLVSTRNVRLHMSLGTFGIALGTGVFLMGLLITIISQGTSNANPSPIANSLAYLSITAVVSFGVLFFLAIRNKGTPDVHKRLTLFSAINLLPPGINRLYGVTFGVPLPLLATYRLRGVRELRVRHGRAIRLSLSYVQRRSGEMSEKDCRRRNRQRPFSRTNSSS